MIKATWSLVVLYENTRARKSAATFCDYLVEQFCVESGLDVHWWSFEELQDSAKVNAHELKQGPQPGATTPGAGGQNQQPGTGQPNQPQRRGNQQNIQPLNPEKNVPLTKGPEPGAPGELQGPGPLISPQPPYGSYNVPKQGAGAGNANPGSQNSSGATGKSSPSPQQ